MKEVSPLDDFTGETGGMGSDKEPKEDPTPRPPKKPLPFRGEGFTIRPAENPKKGSRIRIDGNRDIVSGEIRPDEAPAAPELKNISAEETAASRAAWRTRWKQQDEKAEDAKKKSDLESGPVTPEEVAREDQEYEDMLKREAHDPFQEEIHRNKEESLKQEDEEVRRLRAELAEVEPGETEDERDDTVQVDLPKK